MSFLLFFNWYNDQLTDFFSIRIRLQLLEHTKTGSTALNVALFNSATTPMSRSNAKPMTTSGTYSEALAGVVTPLVTLAKGRYEVIPSSYVPGVLLPFRLIVYTSVGGVEVRKIQ